MEENENAIEVLINFPCPVLFAFAANGSEQRALQARLYLHSFEPCF